MRNIYLKVPSSPEEWLTVAEKFESRWQFPNCIGAIDGKHIAMQPPGNSGSYYYNYKQTNSIVLMAVAGPNYECLYYDIGTNGLCPMPNKALMQKSVCITTGTAEQGAYQKTCSEYWPIGGGLCVMSCFFTQM